jgi:hypothetical protein
MKTKDETVTIKLDGADGALYESGRQIGIAESSLHAHTIIQNWIAQRDEGEALLEGRYELNQFLADLDVGANEARRKAMELMKQAIKLGAGKPRERTLRERLRDAMMGAVSGWKG